MIDLHTHTTYSDGSFSVRELLREAEKIGLSVLSITDHNKISAYEELKNPEIRDLFPGKIITGVEITTAYKGETVEILGYNFDLVKMQSFLDKHVLISEKKQIKEFELIKAKYRKLGVIFDETEIQFDPKKRNSRGAFLQEIRKYSENHKFFLCEESIYDVGKFTRNEVYNPKSLLYVDETSLFPSMETAIDMIHQSGGVAFLAHIYAYSPNIANELQTILDTYDLDGLECFYTTFTKEQSEYLVQLCKERGLFMSGGSDFHGTVKSHHDLGVGRGNLCINEDIVLY